MNSRPSGSHNATELLTVVTSAFEFVLKGKIDFSKHVAVEEQPAMQFKLEGDYENIKIYDAWQKQLVEYTGQNLYPIFFENGLYEVIIVPKDNRDVSFYHEFEPFRAAVSKLSRTNLLTGQLHFQNEVGFSEIEIRVDGQTALSVIIEVFPTKLDYKKDYLALIKEVNEEIYNLAYHFIKRTYLRGSSEIYKDPSMAEFYRLISHHIDAYLHAIGQIERQPHHQLEKQYEIVRGDRLKKQDSKTRNYLRKNARKMAEVTQGIVLNGRSYMPTVGLQVKKHVSYDTHENRYVKYTMQRVCSKLLKLKQKVERSNRKGHLYTAEVNEEILNIVDEMIKKVKTMLRKPFWQSIGKLDRSVNSLVLQMGLGYREVYQVYITLAKSIVLQGELYKMSVKDIATLYEYWTYLRLGRILAEKCEPIDQDIVKFSNDGLFLNLQKDRTATRRYLHRETGDKITLQYQYTTGSNTPTITQKPDSMLSIRKIGKNYDYQYIFDAKYRINVSNAANPGPKEDDINTMHRYRDAIVVESGGSYERKAFGAYVLFPLHDEETYRNHPLYKSIDSVNIGGLPFLPESTTLVEEVIDALLSKSADELQEQGVLPIGTKEKFEYDYSNIYKLSFAADPGEE